MPPRDGCDDAPNRADKQTDDKPSRLHDEAWHSKIPPGPCEGKPTKDPTELVFDHYDLYGGWGDEKGKEKATGAPVTERTKQEEDHFWDNFNPNGVNQSSTGDCFLEATIAAMANSEKGREQIRGMIKPNEDGSWTVTFPGDKGSPINVSQKDIDDAKLDPNEAQWAKVLETAGIKYNHDTPLVGWLQKEGMAPFGRASTQRGALKLLTGQDEATDQMVPFDFPGGGSLGFGATSKENVGRDLEEAMREGKPVTVGAGADILRFIGENDSGPLPDQHVYTVTGYDAKTQTVTVRNPWGSMNGTPLAEKGATVDGITHQGDGTLTMSLDTFYTHFNNVELGNTNSTTHSLENVWRSGGDFLGSLGDTGSDIFHGNFGDVPGDLLNAYSQGKFIGTEALYGATSTMWHNLTDHPLEIALGPVGLPLLAAEDLGLPVPHLPTPHEIVDTAGDVVDKAKDIGGGVISFGKGVLGL